jgi:hypothetical protein
MYMTNDAPASAPDSGKRAIDLLREGFFPEWWSFVPVAGKATYVKEWSTKPLTRAQCIQAYEARSDYNGIGVVTGHFSKGLIALDIDGEEADARYRAIAGSEYEAFGEERTMAWTSGKPGRRQILYRVPPVIVEELEKVKTLILRTDGEWHLGHSDVDRTAPKQGELAEGAEYQEVVLRFNQCQSVLPGSVHPSGRRYQWLNYNGQEVALAPGWVLDAIRPYRKPVPWRTEEMSKVMEEEFGQTLLPPRQIRGWFYKEEIQAKLRPRLTDLVFNHPTFEKYGWKRRSGDHPQMMSGCPWHGGTSGTTFQFAEETGCWDCKACGVYGNPLHFIHKIRTNDMYAPPPEGTALETYVAELTTALGYSYPEDARAQVIKEAPRTVMSEREFHEALIKIHDEELNPAIRVGRMAALAAETGRRLTGVQCLAAMDEYRYYEDSRRTNEKKEWWQAVERMQFLVPNLLMKPTQVMLHAAGGLGKTSACMGLATAVGRGTPIRIRGIELPVKQGPVLWIQNDQNPAKLLQDCEDNGINPALDKWFIVKRGFQINHTHEFAEWIRAYKPALVVVDSIGSCSTKMQVEEKDKAFASPFYYYAEKNGDPGESGFPATSIIWIHHDNASGEARGTRYLVAAVDEQWHLRTLSDEEREALRGRGRSPANCRMIQIKKSRLGRQGDLLVVERDQDFAYSVWDYTPTERREDQGQGDPEPNTMALRIVKDRVLEARAEGGEARDRMTAKEVWERLVEEMTGQARQAPSSKTVKRWLDRWVTNGVLREGKPVVIEGQRKPVPSYTLPPTSSRALSIPTGLLSVIPRDRLLQQELRTDTPKQDPEVVRSNERDQPVQKMNGHRPDNAQDVRSNIPVTESDLGDGRTTDKNRLGKEDTRESDQAVWIPSEQEPEVATGSGAGDPLGGALPGGSDAEGPLRGDGAAAPMDGKSPADSDVGGAGPAPLRPDLDAAPLMEWADEDEGDLSFLDQFRSDSDGALG